MLAQPSLADLDAGTIYAEAQSNSQCIIDLAGAREVQSPASDKWVGHSKQTDTMKQIPNVPLKISSFGPQLQQKLKVFTKTKQNFAPTDVSNTDMGTYAAPIHFFRCILLVLVGVLIV